MSEQNTLYIAEPIFSAKLLRFDKNSSFPPIKKIGITTDTPEQRQKELLGTKSPAKIRMVKAWTNIDARKLEAFIHKMLDGLRLDGEYFWDENESLVESITQYVETYHQEASEIELDEPADVIAAAYANDQSQESRISSVVVPKLAALDLKYSISNKGKVASFSMGRYHKCKIGAKTNDSYTFTIFSKSNTTEQAITDFPGAIEP